MLDPQGPGSKERADSVALFGELAGPSRIVVRDCHSGHGKTVPCPSIHWGSRRRFTDFIFSISSAEN